MSPETETPTAQAGAIGAEIRKSLTGPSFHNDSGPLVSSASLVWDRLAGSCERLALVREALG